MRHERVTDPWEAELERCYAIVLRGLIAASGSRDLAEDALQDSIVAALRQRDRDQIRRLDAWLYVVGLRALRKGQWRRRIERSLAHLRGISHGPSADRVAAVEMLERLGQRQREMVIARYWLDMSYREIADHFGVTVGTATSTVTQALRRLRRDMDAEKERAWTTSR